MRPPHPTVSLFNPSENDFCDIDEGIAPLIAALWERGIDTMMCCQENYPGCMWIQFPNSIDAEKFLDLAAPERNDLRERVIQEHSFMGDWDYDIDLIDVSEWYNPETGEIERTGEPPAYLFTVSIRFPVTDYEAVLANVLRSPV